MFEKVNYKLLNARQKENYNFQKVAGELADYGYNCLRLNDDWQGADFIACHMNGSTFLKVQLKGRFTLDKKYIKKNIYIAFWQGEDCYVYPHDEIVEQVLGDGRIESSKSWIEEGNYSWPTLPKWAINVLSKYKI